MRNIYPKDSMWVADQFARLRDNQHKAEEATQSLVNLNRQRDAADYDLKTSLAEVNRIGLELNEHVFARGCDEAVILRRPHGTREIPVAVLKFIRETFGKPVTIEYTTEREHETRLFEIQSQGFDSYFLNWLADFKGNWSGSLGALGQLLRKMELPANVEASLSKEAVRQAKYVLPGDSKALDRCMMRVHDLGYAQGRTSFSGGWAKTRVWTIHAV